MTKQCQKCDGCGQVATDEDESPWTLWEELPESSKLAIHIGLVRPVQCDKCDGTGQEAQS